MAQRQTPNGIEAKQQYTIKEMEFELVYQRHNDKSICDRRWRKKKRKEETQNWESKEYGKNWMEQEQFSIEKSKKCKHETPSEMTEEKKEENYKKTKNEYLNDWNECNTIERSSSHSLALVFLLEHYTAFTFKSSRNWEGGGEGVVFGIWGNEHLHTQ